MNMTALQQLFGFRTRLADDRFHYDSEFALFEVWQVNSLALEYVEEMKTLASKKRRCFSQHLHFPRDYHLVAFIVGRDLDDVLACMKLDEKGADNVNGVWLRSDPMAISIGDAIVTPDGDVQCVTPCGFCPMQKPQFS